MVTLLFFSTKLIFLFYIFLPGMLNASLVYYFFYINILHVVSSIQLHVLLDICIFVYMGIFLYHFIFIYTCGPLSEINSLLLHN